MSKENGKSKKSDAVEELPEVKKELTAEQKTQARKMLDVVVNLQKKKEAAVNEVLKITGETSKVLEGIRELTGAKTIQTADGKVMTIAKRGDTFFIKVPKDQDILQL